MALVCLSLVIFLATLRLHLAWRRILFTNIKFWYCYCKKLWSNYSILLSSNVKLWSHIGIEYRFICRLDHENLLRLIMDLVRLGLVFFAFLLVFCVLLVIQKRLYFVNWAHFCQITTYWAHFCQITSVWSPFSP